MSEEEKNTHMLSHTGGHTFLGLITSHDSTKED